MFIHSTQEFSYLFDFCNVPLLTKYFTYTTAARITVGRQQIRAKVKLTTIHMLLTSFPGAGTTSQKASMDIKFYLLIIMKCLKH